MILVMGNVTTLTPPTRAYFLWGRRRSEKYVAVIGLVSFQFFHVTPQNLQLLLSSY